MTRYCIQRSAARYKVRPELWGRRGQEATTYRRAARIADYLNARILRSTRS